MTEVDESEWEQAAREGLANAQVLATALAEINDAIAKLGRHVRKVTDGKVTVQLAEPRKTRNAARVFRQLLESWTGFDADHVDPEDITPRRTELLATIPNATSTGHTYTRKLCDITIDQNGYPVAFNHTGGFSMCEDVCAVEELLKSILRSAQTGRKLQALVRLHDEATIAVKPAIMTAAIEAPDAIPTPPVEQEIARDGESDGGEG